MNHFASHDVLKIDATVLALIEPLLAYARKDPQVTEICLNEPGVIFVETGAQWQRLADPQLTMEWALSLARAVATYTDQDISKNAPILSAMLPDGERVQIVQPPAVEPGHISLTIRIPSAFVRPLSDYTNQGMFSRYRWAKSGQWPDRQADLSATEQRLAQHLTDNDLQGFIELAVRARKNIAVVGDTGSGKTTLMKSACQAIPTSERLITIEDVRELSLPQHPNTVHLLYSRGGQGVARVTPADLIASNLRMKPDRVLLAELRGSEAFDFLKLLTTGHSGSLTSFHAESCALAYERYVFMCKEHRDATSYDSDSLKRLVALTIDIILHVVAQNVFNEDGDPIRKDRYVAEVHFDPIAKLQAQYGSAQIHSAARTSHAPEQATQSVRHTAGQSDDATNSTT